MFSFNVGKVKNHRAKTGHCDVQAANHMAVLNIAGLDPYWISAVKPGGHDWLYVPEYDVTLSNGRINKHGSVMEEQKIIRFLEHENKWAFLLPYTYYSGTMKPQKTIETLKYLKNKHNEKFYGGIMIEETNKPEYEKVSYENLVKSIKDNKNEWSPFKI